MSKASPENEEAHRPFLHLNVVLRESCNIFDLSGKIPFKIYVRVSRAHGNLNRVSHGQPIDVVTNGSLLDVSSALFEGKLLLAEVRGEYPEQPMQDCVKQVLPKELFIDAAYDPLSNPAQVIRLQSGFLAPPTDPQLIDCSFHPAISANFKDDTIYSLRYPPEAYSERKSFTWNGGITWWKLCSDPNLLPDPSVTTDKPEAKVRNAQLPLFKAMANPPRPPQIEYELECSPAVLSLSNPSIMKINVKFRLLETTTYTVMWRKTTVGLKTTALGSEGISSSSFDVFDVDTREAISGTPKCGTSMWTAGLPRATPIRREQLRELTPGQTYTGDCTIDGGRDHLSTILKDCGTAKINLLLGRRLGVRLRPIATFWAVKGIDELFEHEDRIKVPYWYIPLTIESPAVTEFRVVL